MNKTTVKSYAVILLIAFLLSVVACASVPEETAGESATTNEIETEYSSETQTVSASTSEVATETEAATETATVIETATETVTETETSTEADSNTGDEENTTEVDFSKLTYVAFGDSITYGSDCRNGLAQMEHPYPTLVAGTLSLKSYTNYGIVASTIATGVVNSSNYALPSIYDYVINANPGANIISVMGGVNDYNTNVELGTIDDTSTTTFYGGLKAICETLLDKYPDAFIFLMTPYKEDCYHEFPYTQLNYAGYNLEDYANAVKAVADLYDLPVLDMFVEGQFELEMYNDNSDGIHPSQEFVKEYTAPQIVEFIKENYE